MIVYILTTIILILVTTLSMLIMEYVTEIKLNKIRKQIIDIQDEMIKRYTSGGNKHERTERKNKQSNNKR